jgi:uncharacterized protein (TIGR02145 family)
MKKNKFSILLTFLVAGIAVPILVSCHYHPPIKFDNDGMVTGRCDNAVTDSGTVTCGGQTYRTIKIGSQTWMADNLNYNRSGSACYANMPKYCGIYGRLYNWHTACEVCPEGWHLPSDAEWTTLTNSVGAINTGVKLKAANGWLNGGNGTDDYGFSALPGGGCTSALCQFRGEGSFWWTASEASDKLAWRRYMYDNSSNVHRNAGSTKPVLYYVRCIKTQVSDTDHGNNSGKITERELGVCTENSICTKRLE